MNTTVSKSFGLALLLAVGIIAVLVAMGAFTSQRAAATIKSGATIVAEPNTAGAAAKITIKLSDTLLLSSGNKIIVGFPDGTTLQPNTGVTITGMGSNDKAASATGTMDHDLDTYESEITIVGVIDADGTTTFKEEAEITVVLAIGKKDDEGIKLPTTVGDLDVDINTDTAGSTAVTVKLVVTPPPCVAPSSCLTVSPGGAGAEAEVTVKFTDAADLDVGNTISIELEDFGVPSTISANSVRISGTNMITGTNDRDNAANVADDDVIVSQTAESVSVSGDTISIRIPDMIDTGPADGLVGDTETTVLIRQSAGITLPTAAGDYPAVIITTQTSTAKTTDTIPIDRTLSLSPLSGAKGTTVTASGKGWGSTGPVMLWINDGAGTTDKVGATNNLRDGLEVILAENVAVSGGAFSATFTADTGFSGTTLIQARDAAGNYLTDVAGREFKVTGSLSLDKDSVKVNEALKITLSEYTDGPVTEVKIGGIEQIRPMTGSKDALVPPMVDKGSVTFSINVKDTTPLGTQVVSVTAGDDPETKTATIAVVAVPMTVSPTTAALGQGVTVSATGFNANQTVSLIRVGSGEADIDMDNNQTDGNGNITISFDVPEGAGTGERLILITVGTRVGEARITVPSPTLTLSASESRRNSSVTASGTGFVANDSILLKYEINNERTRSVGIARTDSVGAWSVQFTVPADAEIGQTNTVTATSSAEDDADVSIATATAEHTLPGAEITLDPASAASGETIKISGASFPAYSGVDVSIGNIDLSAGIQTDADGFFASDVTVPQLPPGTHNVLVTQGDINISRQLVIPVDTTQTVEKVFADLIANESLQTIWRYDFDTRTWTSYTTDPETSFANDLFEVESSDILNINVSSEQTFSHQKGSSLFEGWNLITLN